MLGLYLNQPNDTMKWLEPGNSIVKIQLNLDPKSL
ncbi:hypothetical protein LEMLEM_LOCUS11278 [Lemmus lemmus]